MNDIHSSNEDIFPQYGVLKKETGEEQIIKCLLMPPCERKISLSSESESSSPRGARTWGGARGCSVVWQQQRTAPGGRRGAERRVKGARVRSARARLARPGTPRTSAGGGDHAHPPGPAPPHAHASGWRHRTHLRNIARGHLEDMYARYADENAQLRQQRHHLQTELRTMRSAQRIQMQVRHVPFGVWRFVPCGPTLSRTASISLEAESQAMALQLRVHGGGFKEASRHKRSTRQPAARDKDEGEDEILKPLSLQQLEIERLHALIGERRQELNQLRRGLADDRRALLAVREQVRLKRRALAADIRTIRWHRTQLSQARKRSCSRSPMRRRDSPSPTPTPKDVPPPRSESQRRESPPPARPSYPSPYAATVVRTASVPRPYSIPRTASCTRAYSVPRTSSNPKHCPPPYPPSLCAEAPVTPLDSDLDTAILPSSSSSSSSNANAPPALFSIPDTLSSSESVLVRETRSQHSDEDGADSYTEIESSLESPPTVESDPDTVLVPATESDAELQPLRSLDGRKGLSSLRGKKAFRSKAVLTSKC